MYIEGLPDLAARAEQAGHRKSMSEMEQNPCCREYESGYLQSVVTP